MADTDIKQQIELINNKLDLITSAIYEEKARHMSSDDLKADLMKISSSAMQEGSKQLEGVYQYLSIDDAIYMTKKIVLNINNFTKLIDALENMMNFLESFMPLTKDMFTHIQDKLVEIEKSGYLDLIKILKEKIDGLMQNTSREELVMLGNNIVAFLYAARNTHLDFTKSNKSIFHLMQDINSREMKGVIDTILQFVSNFDKERKIISK